MPLKKQTTKCQECVAMLKRVLSQAESRPRALLEALGSSHDFVPTDTGVLVSFQGKPSQPKQTKPIQTPEPSSSTLSTPQPLLAASAATQRSTRLKIECRPCGIFGAEGGARAFVMGPTPLSIVLCSNRLHSLGNPTEGKGELEEVLVHELIHIYDVKSLKLDLRKCVNLAYSEIRAAREAECRDSWMQPYCVKQKALQATSNLFPKQAGDCISQAYDAAMHDMRPFANIKDSRNDHSER